MDLVAHPPVEGSLGITASIDNFRGKRRIIARRGDPFLHRRGDLAAHDGVEPRPRAGPQQRPVQRRVLAHMAEERHPHVGRSAGVEGREVARRRSSVPEEVVDCGLEDAGGQLLLFPVVAVEGGPVDHGVRRQLAHGDPLERLLGEQIQERGPQRGAGAAHAQIVADPVQSSHRAPCRAVALDGLARPQPSQ